MSLIADALKRAQSSGLARRYSTSGPTGILPVAKEAQHASPDGFMGSLVDRIQLSGTIWIGLGSGIFLFVLLFVYFFYGAETKGRTVRVRKTAELILTEPPLLPVVEFSPAELERELAEETAGAIERSAPASLSGPQDQEVAKVTPDGEEAGPGDPVTSGERSNDGGAAKISVVQDLSEEVRYRFNLGLLYQDEGNFRLARREYEKVVQIWPLYTEGHNNLAVVYKELGMYDRGIVHLKRALALNPEYARAYHNLGVIHQIKKNFEKAEKNYKKALSLDRNHLGAYNNMGLVYRSKSQHYEARKLLEKALTIDPGYAQTHYNLALVLEDLGEEEKALFHYRKFVELADDGNRRIVEKVRTHLRALVAGNR